MIDVSLASVFLVSFALCALFVHLTGLFNGKRYPDGPWGVPIVGHLPFLGEYPPATFKHWQRRYGDVFRIKMGLWNTVVVNGYDTVREAAEMADDAFSGRPDFVLFVLAKQCSSGHEGLSFAAFQQSYLHCRKQAASALRVFTNENASETAKYAFISTEAKCLAETLVQKSRKGPIIMDDDIVLAVGRITFGIVYGRCDIGSKESHIQDQLDMSSKFTDFIGKGNPIDLVPWLQHVMPTKMKVLKHLLQQEIRNHDEQVQEHLESFDEATVQDVTDFVIKLQLGSGCNHEQTKNSSLTNAVKDLFGAGFETTKTVLKWFLLYITAYPTVQAKIQVEIDTVFGATADVKPSRKHSLPYTMAVIYEVLRITSVFPFALPHAAVKDVNFSGYDIDRDTVIFFNLHSINFDCDFWGDPESFSPERMLNKAGELDVEKIKRVATFSYGRRRCLGERLVMNELFVILGTLLQRCTFTKPEGEDLDLTPNVGFIYAPKIYRVTVTDRNV